jgi:hypothetical protein
MALSCYQGLLSHTTTRHIPNPSTGGMSKQRKPRLLALPLQLVLASQRLYESSALVRFRWDLRVRPLADFAALCHPSICLQCRKFNCSVIQIRTTRVLWQRNKYYFPPLHVKIFTEIKHDAVNYGGMGVKLRSFLTSSLKGGE